MPRPERCYKTALYSWPVEAVNWAASLPRPDATGLYLHYVLYECTCILTDVCV